MIAKPNFSTREDKKQTSAVFCGIVCWNETCFLYQLFVNWGFVCGLVQKTKTATMYAWVCLSNANKESCVISRFACSVPQQSREWVFSGGELVQKGAATVTFPDQLVFLCLQKVSVTQLPESSSQLGGRKATEVLSCFLTEEQKMVLSTYLTTQIPKLMLKNVC